MRFFIHSQISRKYNIQAGRGLRVLFEILSIGLLFVSAALKSNVLSFCYLLCIMQYFIFSGKAKSMLFNLFFLGLSMTLCYIMAVLNLNRRNSPREFPILDYSDYLNGEFIIPIFQYIPFLKENLSWAYFFAMGIDSFSSSYSLGIDFINLVVVTLYFLIFRNPVLRNTIKKITWNSEH